MFDIKGSKSIYNKAEIERIIIEKDNVTIAFKEGYAEDDKFIGVGSDHIILKDEKFTKFLANMNASRDKFEIARLAVADVRKEPLPVKPELEEILPEPIPKSVK